MVRASRSPNGNRNSGRGSAPAAWMACCAPVSCSPICAADNGVKWAWFIEWLPTRWPAARIACTWAGLPAAHWPVRKKVADTCRSRRVARMLGRPAEFAPASKVNATSCRLVGMTVTSCPRSVPGKAGATGGGGVDRSGAGGSGGGVLAGADVGGVGGGGFVVVELGADEVDRVADAWPESSAPPPQPTSSPSATSETTAAAGSERRARCAPVRAIGTPRIATGSGRSAHRPTGRAWQRLMAWTVGSARPDGPTAPPGRRRTAPRRLGARPQARWRTSSTTRAGLSSR